MEEIWLPVPDFGDLYEVSNHGQVRSLYGRSRSGLYRRTLILKPQLRQDGYYYVELWRDGKRRCGKIHKLVTEAFLGPCPDGQEVRHLDDEKSNNNLKNLCYGSHPENAFDMVANGSHPQARKTHCPDNHEYSEENTYVDSKNRRHCRACSRAAAKRSYESKHSKSPTR